MRFQRFTPSQGAMQGGLFDAGPQQIHRLFFALMPDLPTRERIAALAQELKAAHALRGQWVSPERYHATLHFLGDNSELRPDLTTAAIAAAATIRMAPVAVHLDGACTFRRAGHNGKSPGVLRDTAAASTSAYALWKALGSALAAQGFGSKLERSFVPHVTLLYQSQDDLPDVVIEPIAWTATEFVLIHSVFKQPDYRVIGRWLLREPDAAP